MVEFRKGKRRRWRREEGRTGGSGWGAQHRFGPSALSHGSSGYIYHEGFDTLSFPRADWATFKHTLAFKKSLVIQQ